MYTSFSDNPNKPFSIALNELSVMVQKGFKGFLFRSVGSFMEAHYINVSINDESDKYSPILNCTLEKRYVDDLYNNESNLVVGDFLANYDMEICIKLYGHPHHSVFGDKEDEAMYIPKIEICPSLISTHYDNDDAVYSRIPWDYYTVGYYQVMLFDHKNGYNSSGGILSVWYDESGEKRGYISKERYGVL